MVFSLESVLCLVHLRCLSQQPSLQRPAHHPTRQLALPSLMMRVCMGMMPDLVDLSSCMVWSSEVSRWVSCISRALIADADLSTSKACALRRASRALHTQAHRHTQNSALTVNHKGHLACEGWARMKLCLRENKVTHLATSSSLVTCVLLSFNSLSRTLTIHQHIAQSDAT